MQPRFICFTLILFILPCLLFGQSTDTTLKKRKGSKLSILSKKNTPSSGYKINEEPSDFIDLIVDEDSGPQYSCITANAGNNVTICPGSSTTIGANTYNSNYDYSWSPSTGLSSSSIPNPIASPGQTTTYTLTMTPKPNLLINGSFEQGNYGFTSDYTENAGSYNYQAFAITNSPSNVYPWFCQKSPPNGSNMFVGDGAITTNQKVWSQSLIVNPNQQYTFSGQFSSVFNANNGNDTHIIIDINGTRAYSVLSNNNCQDWTTLTLAWYAGPYDNFVTITIYADPGVSGTGFGNDFAMDNLVFTPGSCNITTSSVTVNMKEKPSLTISEGLSSEPPGRLVTILPNGDARVCLFGGSDISTNLNFTTTASTNLQWFQNGSPIPSANNQVYTKLYNGGLYLQNNPVTETFTVSDGCTISDPKNVIYTMIPSWTNWQVTSTTSFEWKDSLNFYASKWVNQRAPNYEILISTTSPSQVSTSSTNDLLTTTITIPPVFPTAVTITPVYHNFDCYVTATDRTVIFDGSINPLILNSSKSYNIIEKKPTKELDQLTENQIVVSPNPAKNNVLISVKSPFKRIQIFSSDGNIKKVYNKSGIRASIDIGNLLPGIYFVKIIFDKRVQTEKLIISK